MRRVLHLIKGLGRGGAEQLLVSAVRNGDRSRFVYEVAFLLPAKNAFVPELRAIGISVHCLTGAANLWWPYRLREIVHGRRVDLVHIHSPYPAAFARLAVGHRVPVVYTEHNIWSRYRTATYWANVLTYGWNRHVFAVS